MRLGYSLLGEDLHFYMTYVFDNPLSVLKYKAERLIKPDSQEVETYERMKLSMLVAHDTQAINLLKWLSPTNLPET